MDRPSTPEHWNAIYGKYERHELGWYTPRLATSLEWIEKHSPHPLPSIIDIGGGSSTLLDDLIDKGYQDITLVDISETALEETKRRLGNRAGAVRTICSDIRSADLVLPPVQVWHDRAAFHFLRNSTEIAAYKALLLNTLEEKGVFILGVFSVNAPDRCSGLIVNKWDLAGLQMEFSGTLTLLESKIELHITPGGVEQEYLYTTWQKSKHA
ncbi:class I SAM-dependent methyltransferase [bacterium]|nr:class I SAM-dependent methyltransferase [bacterium]